MTIKVENSFKGIDAKIFAYKKYIKVLKAQAKEASEAGDADMLDAIGTGGDAVIKELSLLFNKKAEQDLQSHAGDKEYIIKRINQASVNLAGDDGLDRGPWGDKEFLEVLAKHLQDYDLYKNKEWISVEDEEGKVVNKRVPVTYHQV